MLKQIIERRKQREDTWNKRRRKLIEERLFKKRLAPAYKIEHKADKASAHEEPEEIKEEVMKEDQLDHARYKNKCKRFKKKCWLCRFPYYIKK